MEQRDSLQLTRFKETYPEYQAYPPIKILAAIKTEYPMLKDIDDAELAGILDQYPEKLREAQDQAQAPTTTLSDVGKTVGESAVGFGTGVAEFGASLPSVGGGILQEIGETAEEGPDMIDQVAYQTSPMGGLILGAKKIISKLAKKTDFDEKLAETGRKIVKKNMEDVAKAFPESKTKHGRFFRDLGSGAGSLAASVGLFALTKNPALSAVAFGTMKKSRMYTKAIAAGKTPAEASRLSTAGGVVEGALEGIGLPFLMRRFGGKIATRLIHMGTEGVQELSQSLSGATIEKMGGFNEEEWSEIAKDAVYEGMLGAILGGSASVLMHRKQKLVDKGLTPEEADKTIEYFMERSNELADTIQKEVDPETMGEGMRQGISDEEAAEYGQWWQEAMGGEDVRQGELRQDELSKAAEPYGEILAGEERQDYGKFVENLPPTETEISLGKKELGKSKGILRAIEGGKQEETRRIGIEELGKSRREMKLIEKGAVEGKEKDRRLESESKHKAPISSLPVGLQGVVEKTGIRYDGIQEGIDEIPAQFQFTEFEKSGGATINIPINLSTSELKARFENRVFEVTKGQKGVKPSKDPGLSAKKETVRKKEKPESYRTIVRRLGGLATTGDLAGEVERLPHIKNKSGLTVDQMTERLQQEGYQVESARDLLDKLRDDQQYVPDTVEADISGRVKHEKQVVERFKPEPVGPEKLEMGDKVDIQGEEHTVLEKTPGGVRLKDHGPDVLVDSDDVVYVDEGKIDKVKAETSKPQEKQPWEMTFSETWEKMPGSKFDEYAKQADTDKFKWYKEHPTMDDKVRHKDFHKTIIQQALSEGKPVPPEVLKDYPELQKLPTVKTEAGDQVDHFVRNKAEDMIKDLEAIKENMPRHALTPQEITDTFNWLDRESTRNKLEHSQKERINRLAGMRSSAEVPATTKVPGAKHKQIVSPELLGQAKAPTVKIKPKVTKIKPITGEQGVGLFKKEPPKTGDMFEEAKPAEEKETDEPERTSARQLDLADDRKAMGLSPVNSKDVKTFKEALDQSRKENISDRALRIASEVLQKPRALSPVEKAGMVDRAARLKDEYRDLSARANSSKEDGEIQTLVAEARRVEDEFEAISRAVYIAGSESGRSLVFQKLTLDEGYDLLSVSRRAAVAKGAKLTETEKAKFAELSTRLDDTMSQIAALEKQISDMKAHSILREGSVKKYKKMTKEQKDTELTDLIEKTKKLLAEGCNE